MGRLQLLDQGYGSGADNPPPTFDQGTQPQAPTPAIPAPAEPRVTDAPTGTPSYGTQPVGRTTENPYNPAPLFGGVAPTMPPAGSNYAPYTNNSTPRVYRGANGSLFTDDPNPNSVSGFIPYNAAGASGPAGIDPRIMALYQKYGITPGERGSGPADWQYYQNDALKNASGDMNYVLGRLEGDLSGGKAGIYRAPEGPGQGGSYGGTGVFNDPATAAFEQLLNQRIGQLQTPYQPPGMQPALDYLNKYFQQLQGPAYTPDQMNLMQTQTLDPLSRERDANRQRITQYYASHGMSPDSGVVQKALQDADQNFERLRTQTQAQFATGAINTQKQQQAQAAGLGPQIAAIEQNQFNNQEGRLNQAVNLAQTIPNMAWSRLTGSGNIMQQTNPMAALQLQNQFQQQGYGQGQDFSQGLMGILPYLIQLYGGSRG